MLYLRKSTASQRILLGPFVDHAQGREYVTDLAITAADVRVWKAGDTTEASCSGGGATHIAGGRYHATLDATDTDTTGPLALSVNMPTSRPYRLDAVVLEAAVYDALFAPAAVGYPTAAEIDAVLTASHGSGSWVGAGTTSSGGDTTGLSSEIIAAAGGPSEVQNGDQKVKARSIAELIEADKHLAAKAAAADPGSIFRRITPPGAR